MKASDVCSLSGSIVKVRFHPRLSRLAALAKEPLADELVIWNTSNGFLQEMLRFRVEFQEPADIFADRRKGRFMDVAFHSERDSLYLVRHKQQLESWRLPQGISQAVSGDGDADNALAFSFDGRWLVYATRPSEFTPGQRRRTRLCDLNTGKQFELDCETDTTFAFHPFSSVIAAGWNDQGGGEIRLLTTAFLPPRFVSAFDASCWVDGLTFAPDGESLAVLGGAGFAGNFCLQVYDFNADSGNCGRKRLERLWQATPTEDTGWDLPWADQVVYSADSSRLICPDGLGGLVELDAKTGALTNRWHEHERLVTTVDVAHEIGLLASGARDGQIVLWDLS